MVTGHIKYAIEYLVKQTTKISPLVDKVPNDGNEKSQFVNNKYLILILDISKVENKMFYILNLVYMFN